MLYREVFASTQHVVILKRSAVRTDAVLTRNKNKKKTSYYSKYFKQGNNKYAV